MVAQTDSPFLRRLGQFIFAINVALVAAGLILLLVRDIEPPSSDVAGIWFLWPISALVYGVLALLILTKQPRHTVGWLFQVVGLFTAVTVLFFGIGDVDFQILPEIPGTILSYFGELIWIVALFVPMTLVPQFFPDGRLPSRRWWPVAAASIIAIFALWLGFLQEYSLITLNEGLIWLLNILNTIGFPLAVIGTIALVIVRYFRSRGTERTQMKWLAYTVVVGFLVGFLLMLIFEEEDNPIISGFFVSLPTLIAASIGIAVLRYRLYDIDILIRRTLQYGILTAILVLIYFGLVIVFQSIFVELGGQQSPIFIVISTLVVAALFNPLRRRIQGVIDRRFFRRKYNAQKALDQFATVARDEVDLEKLTAELLEVVQQTIQPERIGITFITDD